MDHGWGSFRTTDGDVSVGNDTIRIDKSTGKFLRGQRSRWRNGDRGDQLAAVARVLLFVWAPLYAVYQLSTTFELVIGVVGALSLFVIALQFVAFYLQYFRSTEVRLSAIENVALETDDRELTITHDAGGRVAVLDDDTTRKWFSSIGEFSPFGSRETETELALLTNDDVREARTVLRTRRIPMEIDAAEPETETEYRVEMKNGVVFCDGCGSQVSPNDRHCPSCDRALRIERSTGKGKRNEQPAESGERERLLEF